MTQDKPRRCPACRQSDLQPAIRVREFHPQGRAVVVELLTSRCPACGAEATAAAQHSENLHRLAARKAQYGDLLLGEEILALRRRYGITQRDAAKIFGKGKIAFSRYENETSYPDPSTTKLLKVAIEMRDVLRRLADEAGVELPLWKVRCGEERNRWSRGGTELKDLDANAAQWAAASFKEASRVKSELPFQTIAPAQFTAQIGGIATDADEPEAAQEAYG